ncbi:Fur family transcriptional regulator [Salinisphaera sp. Q1T1-3]|uniref:Fur family transcriptional regulator n=1 Tax=Salinisphaera sp. Q1T1-3 TaxID=2321229 RepID=UPI000E7145BA|nr:Fur family transcriptional regulator [Salinisphaera sp. Q1T1-3]RJS91963.1 transcriptional repressor [Salinisphaera sp. Q1T1-3]
MKPKTTEELRAAGLRVTRPRRAVLDWLDDNPHATAEQVHEGVRPMLGSVSRQAIYDVLSACASAHLIRQIRPAGHPARFERRAGDNHHHLVCRCCGDVFDAECHTGHAPCLHPTHDQGFHIDEAEIVFWGICPSCQPLQASATPDDDRADVP